MALDFDKYKAQQFCDNIDCGEYGKIGKNNIRTHSRLQHQGVIAPFLNAYAANRLFCGTLADSDGANAYEGVSPHSLA